MNIAQISPSLNAYSETFIQNHKKIFDADVKYYYGGILPLYLENHGNIQPSFVKQFIHSIGRKFFSTYKKHSALEYAIIKSFKKEKIDLVFAEYGPTGVAILNICKEMNLPLIVNFHGYDASRHDVLSSHAEEYRNLFQYASAIIGVSKIMVEKLISIGCPESKIKYIVYGPEDTFFKTNPTYQENSFLAIGRFTEKKAPYYSIFAFKKVMEKYPDAKLYMAGNGELYDTCKNISQYLNLNNNIEFLGIKTHEELLPYYQNVRAFVQHSITAASGDMEGTPVAILEASAAALPVISTFHAGISDVIINQETGLLVNEHDVDGMAKNMIYLLENKDVAINMGTAGRKNIKENYRMEIHAKKLNTLIKECLNH